MRFAAWSALRPQMIRAFRQSAADGRGDPALVARRTDAQLRAAIADAARSVPFYRDHWAGHGILAAAERGEVALTDLPVLTRGDLQGGFAALRRAGSEGERVVDRTTGGSTGEPVRFLQAWSYLESASGRGLRSLAWGGWEIGARTALVWGGPNELRSAASPRDWLKARLTNRRVFDAFRTGPEVYAAWIDAWRRWRPRFVLGYASALDGVASHLIASGETLRGVAAVFSTAERLYPEQRQRIARAFAAPVRDQYGSREVQAVAAECTEGRLHAYLDSAYLELLPSETSELQRVALTQLDNPVMPLIRYVNGDLSRWSGDATRCRCGLSYPSLTGIHGRVSDLFRFPTGRVVHGEYFTHVMYEVRGVSAFQFYQSPAGAITLFVQPAASASVDALRQELRGMLERLPRQVGVDASIDLEFVREIPRRGQGKHRFTLSEYAG